MTADTPSNIGDGVNTMHRVLGTGEHIPYVAVDQSSLVADDLTLLASAVRAATNSSADQTVPEYVNGALLFLNVTAVTAAQTLNLILEGKDPVSGVYFPISQTGALGGAATLAGLYGLGAHPGFNNLLSASLTALFGNAVAIPRVWRARVVHSGGGNFTYSLGGNLLRA